MDQAYLLPLCLNTSTADGTPEQAKFTQSLSSERKWSNIFRKTKNPLGESRYLQLNSSTTLTAKHNVINTKFTLR